MKKTLITGVGGQDGRYLAELLLANGYRVFGLVQKGTDVSQISDSVEMLYGDLEDHDSLRKIVETTVPDEVYNLAGVSDLKTAYAHPEMTMNVNYRSVEVLLEATLKANPRARFLQASSSEIFLPSPRPLDETSPRDWDTENPYAKAKMMADRDHIEVARAHGAFACSAFLFTHTSPRSSEKAVSRKITQTLSRIKRGREQCLRIGNVDTKRDWGFAGDYVEAMWRMLQQDVPEDLIIATGRTHSVKDFVNIATQFLYMNLVWHGSGVDTYAVDKDGRKVVVVDPEFYKESDSYFKVGNTQKAKRAIGWEPKVDFTQLVEMMVRSDSAEVDQRM